VPTRPARASRSSWRSRGGVVVALGGQAERGTGTARRRPAGAAPTGSEGVSLKQSGAGTSTPGRRRAETPRRGRASSTASRTPLDHETYRPRALEQKGGVGIYVDAARRPRGAIDVDRPHRAGAGRSTGPATGRPAKLEDWCRCSTSPRRGRNELRLGGTRYRYFLVWISALPPGERSVAISEISLLQQRR
jgi:hypothetical protein